MFLFDFDGVIVDSLREAALNAYGCVTDQLCYNLAETPSGYWELFRRNRFLLQPAGDFLPFASWCIENGPKDPNRQLTYQELREIVEKTTVPYKERTAKFFANRTKFFEHDPERWLALNSTMEPLCTYLREHPEIPLVLLTNKNRVAVGQLCGHFKLPVKPENIFSGDGGVKKIENLQLIAERFPGKRFSFIDDSVLNLIGLQKQLGATITVELFLALWGYVGPDDRAAAQTHGFLALGQSDLISLLGDNSASVE